MSRAVAGPIPFSPRLGLIYAAGDVGPSLTSLCLSFYWLYFLVTVAGLSPPVAGLIHASGYAVSALANLWAGHSLDRHATQARTRAGLIAVLGGAMALLFAGLWWVIPGGTARIGWYVALSWLFHLCFSFVYLSYLSLTTLLGGSQTEQVDLSSYRFGGTMAFSLIVLAGYAASEGSVAPAVRLEGLGLAVALIAAAGALACGLGLRRRFASIAVAHGDGSLPWVAIGRDNGLRASFAANLAVWFIVQTTLVLTAFLCARAGVRDGPILLLLQATIIVAAALTSLGARRVAGRAMMIGAAGCWCLGALLWWTAAPYPAAALLGLGLGAGTVLSWAEVSRAVATLAASGRAEARAYAALTVLRDLVSALVPSLAGLVLGRSGGGATALLVAVALVSALLVLVGGRR